MCATRLTHLTSPAARAAVGLPPAAARCRRGRWSPKVRAGARPLTVRCKSIDTAASAFGINDDSGIERDLRCGNASGRIGACHRIRKRLRGVRGPHPREELHGSVLVVRI